MTMPALGFRRTTARVARHPIVWRARTLGVNADNPITGTMVRAATAAPTDTVGTARTVVHSQPAWQYNSGKAKTGLLMGTNAQLGWPLPIAPQAMMGAVHFIENGGKAVVSGGVWYIGNDAATGARFYIDATGSFYRITYTDGATTRTNTLAAAPSNGDEVWLRFGLTLAGVAQIWQSINGAAETTPGALAALALPAAWSATAGVTTCHLNSVGTANQGNNLYLDFAIMLGAPALTALQAVVG